MLSLPCAARAIRFPPVAWRRAMLVVVALLACASISHSTRAATKPGAKRPQKATASAERVLWIGIDGADWSEINPLVAAGKMPNMARLLAHGASGPLLTILPLTKSPVIWTTIATGKTPAKHGINDFLTGSIPTTSNQWLAKPVWEILG